MATRGNNRIIAISSHFPRSSWVSLSSLGDLIEWDHKQETLSPGEVCCVYFSDTLQENSFNWRHVKTCPICDLSTHQVCDSLHSVSQTVVEQLNMLFIYLSYLLLSSKLYLQRYFQIYFNIFQTFLWSIKYPLCAQYDIWSLFDCDHLWLVQNQWLQLVFLQPLALCSTLLLHCASCSRMKRCPVQFVKYSLQTFYHSGQTYLWDHENTFENVKCFDFFM